MSTVIATKPVAAPQEEPVSAPTISKRRWLTVGVLSCCRPSRTPKAA